MTQFDDRFKNHDVWNVLETLKSSASTAQQKLREEKADKSIIDAVDRLLEVQRHIQGILQACDPILVPETSLTNLNSQLSSLDQQLKSFLQNSNTGHLIGGNQNASQWADAALQTVAQIHVPRTAKEIEGLRNRVTRFRRSAGVHLANLQKDTTSARDQAKEAQDLVASKTEEIEQRLNTQLEEIDQAVDKGLRETQEKASNALSKLESDTAQTVQRLEKRIEAHEQNLENQKKRIDDSITEFQSQFSTAQETRREDFAKEQKTRRDEFQEILDEATSALEKSSKSFEENANEILARMKKSEEEVVRVMEVVGTTGLTGGFKKAANEERQAADLWRWIAVASIVAVIGVAAWTVFWSDAQSSDWYALAKKIFLTAAIGWLAAYAIRESGAHRDREKRNRRLELQLASLNPYLANLRPEMQEKIKDELIKTLFREQEETPQATPEGGGWISMDKLADLIQRILNRPGT